MFRHPPAPISIGEEVGQISWRSAAMKGVLVNVPNPKAFMFFLAYHLSSDAAWQIPTQLFTLGMVYTVSCSVVYMLVGYGARIVLSTRPTAACFVSRESGNIMLLILQGHSYSSGNFSGSSLVPHNQATRSEGG